eukprot:COSAG01_NODE_25623_length_739_cov_0.918750_1_plen_109_part_01
MGEQWECTNRRFADSAAVGAAAGCPLPCTMVFCGLAAAAAAATRMRAGHQTFASFLFSCCFVSCTRTATAREAPSGWEAARLMTGYACALCHCGRSFDLSEVARLQPTP